ncbi:MAG: APC family permease [Gemmatimonadota bacterium]|nr:APC family permease [Gemmatimonadota bacterium]MDH5283091.1 APC family permease [Gemmatimonadota bacterium]
MTGPTSAGTALPRAIGRAALIGLLLNAVIGSSVFGLPSVMAARLGDASPWAWVIAAVGMAVVVACFAEVASRFTAAGGTYLYARVAFGRLAGIEMGWLTYLVRLTAAATNANLLVIYLGAFWPEAGTRLMAPVVLALVLIPLAAANYRGVKTGVGVSSFFTVAKLLPLGLFMLVGLLALGTGGAEPVTQGVPPAGTWTWLEAVLLLVFAYGGFEAALLPLGEAKDPRRDAPVALFTTLVTCTVLYTTVQLIVSRVLPDAGSHQRPLAEAARILTGPTGAALLAAGAVISTYGYLAGSLVNVPRLTFAMAEQGDLPAAFGVPHPRFHTPYRSVIVFAVLVWLLASSGSFISNLSLSAASRLLTYGAVCLALPVLRRRDADVSPTIEPARLTLPAGRLIAGLGVVFSLALVLRIAPGEALVLAATMGLGLGHWWLVRREGRAPEGVPGDERG